MICEKCQQIFDLESRKPMVLHCGHSMCLLCLEEKQTEAKIITVESLADFQFNEPIVSTSL